MACIVKIVFKEMVKLFWLNPHDQDAAAEGYLCENGGSSGHLWRIGRWRRGLQLLRDVFVSISHNWQSLGYAAFFTFQAHIKAEIIEEQHNDNCRESEGSHYDYANESGFRKAHGLPSRPLFIDGAQDHKAVVFYVNFVFSQIMVDTAHFCHLEIAVDPVLFIYQAQVNNTVYQKGFLHVKVVDQVVGLPGFFNNK